MSVTSLGAHRHGAGALAEPTGLPGTNTLNSLLASRTVPLCSRVASTAPAASFSAAFRGSSRADNAEPSYHKESWRVLLQTEGGDVAYRVGLTHCIRGANLDYPGPEASSRGSISSHLRERRAPASSRVTLGLRSSPQEDKICCSQVTAQARHKSP